MGFTKLNTSTTDKPKYTTIRILVRVRYFEYDTESDDEEDENGLVRTEQHADVYIATKGQYINCLFIERNDCLVKIGKKREDGSYKFVNKYSYYRQWFE